jgi:2TM domain
MTSKNPNYKSYLGTATQIQRFRDFSSHLLGYVVINALFVLIWLSQGQGFFWPAFPLVGWGLGLSFQHFNMVLRGQITDEEVRHKMREHDTEAR